MHRQSEDLRICFIGDSFVAGVGDETALGWTGRLLARSAPVLFVGPPPVHDKEHNRRILLLSNDFREICDERG